jgi:SSS family solute:Na+ symporter
MIDPVLPGFVAALGLMVVVSLLTPEPPASATDPFFTDGPADAADPTDPSRAAAPGRA